MSVLDYFKWAFIGPDRLAMQHALRYWCVDGGCVVYKRHG